MDGTWLALTTVGLMALDAAATPGRGSAAHRVFPFLVRKTLFHGLLLPPRVLSATSYPWPAGGRPSKGSTVLVVARTSGDAEYRALGLARLEEFYDPDDELDEGGWPPALARLSGNHTLPPYPGGAPRSTVEGYVDAVPATDGDRRVNVLVMEIRDEPGLMVRRISDTFPTWRRGSPARRRPQGADAWLVVAVRDGRIRQVEGIFWALKDADVARDRLAEKHGRAWVIGQRVGEDHPRYAVVVVLPENAPVVPLTALGVYEDLQDARTEARRAALFDRVHAAGAAGWGPSRDLAIYEFHGDRPAKRIADKKTGFVPRITDAAR